MCSIGYIKVSSLSCWFMFCSLQFYQLLLGIFWGLIVRNIYLWWIYLLCQVFLLEVDILLIFPMWSFKIPFHKICRLLPPSISVQPEKQNQYEYWEIFFFFLQGIGLFNCGGLLGKFKTHRGQSGRKDRLKALSTVSRFLLHQGSLNSAFKALQLMESGPPKLCRVNSFT